MVVNLSFDREARGHFLGCKNVTESQICGWEDEEKNRLWNHLEMTRI